MDANFIRERITQLRIKMGKSEYAMSLELGHSRSYMQNISSGRMLPSMAEFLAICEYLDVSPHAFFDEERQPEPALLQKAVEGMRDLNDKDILMLIGFIDRLRGKDQ